MSNLSDFMGGGSSIVRRQLFTADGTWTKPAGIIGDQVWVTMIGGGGGGSSSTANSYGGNGGDFVQRLPVDVSSVSSAAITVGAAGAIDGTGGVSSFGTLVSVNGNSNTTSHPSGNGAHGSQNASFSSAEAQSPMGVFGGSGGWRAITDGVNDQGSGGGGLVLDDSGTKGGADASQTGGVGYGSGGAARQPGAPGAVLVEWLEKV